MTPYSIVPYEPGAANVIDRSTGAKVGFVLQWAHGWGAYVEIGGELTFGTMPTEERLVEFMGPTRAITRTRYRADAAARVWAEHLRWCAHCDVRPRRRRNGLCDACHTYQAKYHRLPEWDTLVARNRRAECLTG
ncbi:MAG: hypothetical protein NVS9B11_18330 [Candidatus Dormibacteraceae bacterium]